MMPDYRIEKSMAGLQSLVLTDKPSWSRFTRSLSLSTKTLKSNIGKFRQSINGGGVTGLVGSRPDAVEELRRIGTQLHDRHVLRLAVILHHSTNNTTVLTQVRRTHHN